MRIRRLYTIFAASAVFLSPSGFVAPGLVAAATLLSPADCNADRVIFTSQADVDASNCTNIKGTLVIPATAVGNITFTSLLTVGGDFAAEGCNASTADCTPTVAGITSTNLTTVGGRLRIARIATLSSIVLPTLRRVDGALEITDLSGLTRLNLEGINRVGSFHLIRAPELRRADIGRYMFTTDSSIGLKNITDKTNQVVEVRSVGLENLDGLVDFWDAKQFIIEDMPNLQKQAIRVGSVDEVRVSGNGNLTLSFWETGSVAGVSGPNINKLVVSGVKHISPCLMPVVREFVAVNNTVEYLHFNFDQLERFEVRDNPQLKTMVPWPHLNRYWLDIAIYDNPQLLLTAFPERSPDDNLTAQECKDLWNSMTDQWRWFPNRFNSVVVSADVDNTFFNYSFASLYLNASERGATKPRVLKLFEVNSTNPSFSCDALDTLRSEKGAFPGEYSCQGKSVQAGGPSAGHPSTEACLWTVLGAAFLSAMMLL